MPAQVIDLFCGVGGLTKGLTNANFDVIAGFDIDETCRYAYEHNNRVVFHAQDVRNLRGADINALYEDGTVKILVGCAPCQPFSQMRFKMGDANVKDEKYNLLLEYARLIEEVQPEIISMENVPQIRDTMVYKHFLEILKSYGYSIDAKVISCPEYGIPQSRRRFVVIASKYGEVRIIPPTHKKNDVHVRDFIYGLPPIDAGGRDINDKMHCSANLSEKNLERIRISLPGGTWKDWPEHLRCKCHLKDSGQTYSSVYGRMSWEQIGPTITTQFYCYGTGRFGHPEQDRALSLREGALLQTFPLEYDFIDPNKPFSFRDIARHIGNAVPVRLGEIIGVSIRRHLEEYEIAI